MGSVRKLILTLGAAAGLLAPGMTAATAATHHTASACPSSRSNGMCIYYGTQNAWDGNRANNETLDDWAYPGGQTQISSHIHSVTIYSNCTVTFHTGDHFSGSAKAYQGTSAGRHITLPSPWYDGTKSFNWSC